MFLQDVSFIPFIPDQFGNALTGGAGGPVDPVPAGSEGVVPVGGVIATKYAGHIYQ